MDGTRFRLRTGTDLWLGDPAAIEVRATVLDVLPVSRGDRIGYRQHRSRNSGRILMVSGGRAHGVGMEPPKMLSGLLPRATELARFGLSAMNRALSPYTWQGRRLWFAEPPHMSISMLYLTRTVELPTPGCEAVGRLQHTAARFDRVTLLESPDERGAITAVAVHICRNLTSSSPARDDRL